LKYTVFISHSSSDKAVADNVCDFLEGRGVKCWIAPRDVMPGKNYGAAIVDAIDECNVFVLILSNESNRSGQVVREVERAASRNAVVIPFRIADVKPSRDLEFYVSATHWLDATNQPEKHFDALLQAIMNWQNKTEREPSAVPPTFPVEPPVRRSKLPLLVGGAIVAVVVFTFAIFLANRARSPQPTQASTATAAINAAGSPTGSPTETISTNAVPVIRRAVASSELKPEMYMGQLRRYGPYMAFDNDETTAWIPSGSGPGEWIEVHFKEPTAISSISIYGGYGADAARYQTNNRVRELRMTFPNGFSRVFELADKMQFQRFELPKHPVLHTIKFEIVTIYSGSKYNSTPISEIAFNRPQ
jgi:hypothetical protein